MKNKGALELSMNTIVIIVIGVVLLAGGLIFVNKIFDLGIKIIDTTAQGVDNQINKIATHDQKLTVNTISVERGKEFPFRIWVVNELNEKKTFKIEAVPTGDTTSDVQIRFASDEAPIDPGEEVGFGTLVSAKKGISAEARSFNIIITADGEPYAEQGFFVIIE